MTPLHVLNQGEALWPGKSDVDQLYLIRKNVGDLIPRHMAIFKTNEFFAGLIIPDPGVIDPIDKKLPKDLVGSEGIDFMKVSKIASTNLRHALRYITYYKYVCIQKCLDKDPAKRWSCEQLLQHPFFDRHSFKKPDYHDLERMQGRVSLD